MPFAPVVKKAADLVKSLPFAPIDFFSIFMYQMFFRKYQMFLRYLHEQRDLQLILTGVLTCPGPVASVMNLRIFFSLIRCFACTKVWEEVATASLSV